MQVNVLDPAANEVAFARVPLAIVPASAKAAQAGKKGEQGTAGPGAAGE
jgi:hypothetical protein